MASHGGDGSPHVPAPTLWPVGFAVGIAVLLVGVVLGWLIVAIGAAIAAIFGFLWIREATSPVRREEPLAAQAAEPETRPVGAAPPAHLGRKAMPEPGEGEIVRFPRSKLLEGATLGLGVVIGGVVTLPILGPALVDPFVDQETDDVDVGALDEFPENRFVITTFLLDPEQGEVSRRTAYVRNNGLLDGQPSFTILSSRCVHLGCPVQVNGLPIDDQAKTEQIGDAEVRRIPTAAAAGFGCPCHGGQYDAEGNRTAGPPVRALDRYEFKVRNGRLLLSKTYSVGSVEGKGSEAQIKKYDLMGPGQHVDGPEAVFYPIEPPR